jgi:WD40 repeat protein
VALENPTTRILLWAGAVPGLIVILVMMVLFAPGERPEGAVPPAPGLARAGGQVPPPAPVVGEESPAIGRTDGASGGQAEAADPGGVAYEHFEGTLTRLVRHEGEVHLLVDCGGLLGEPWAVEAVAYDPDFVEQLADYRSGQETGVADRVELAVNETVARQPAFLLDPTATLAELKEIRRVGDPSSRAVVGGQPWRTYREHDDLTDLAALLYARPAVGRRIECDAYVDTCYAEMLPLRVCADRRRQGCKILVSRDANRSLPIRFAPGTLVHVEGRVAQSDPERLFVEDAVVTPHGWSPIRSPDGPLAGLPIGPPQEPTEPELPPEGAPPLVGGPEEASVVEGARPVGHAERWRAVCANPAAHRGETVKLEATLSRFSTSLYSPYVYLTEVFGGPSLRIPFEWSEESAETLSVRPLDEQVVAEVKVLGGTADTPELVLLSLTVADNPFVVVRFPEPVAATILEARLTVQADAGGLAAVAWSPDGDMVLTGGRDAVPKVWDASTGKIERQLRGHGATIAAVAWGPESDQVATAGNEGSVRIWSLGVGNPRRMQMKSFPLPGRALSLDWTGGGERLAAGLHNGSFLAWNPVGLANLVPGQCSSERITGVAWHPEEPGYLAVVDAEGTLWVLDVDRGRPLCGRADDRDDALRFVIRYNPFGAIDPGFANVNVVERDTRAGFDLAWSPDGRRLAAAETTLELWDFDEDEGLTWAGTAFRAPRTAASAPGPVAKVLHVASIDWHPGGRYLAGGATGGWAAVWDVSTGAAVAALECSTPAAAVAFSPDGGQLAVGCLDGRLLLCDVSDALENEE